MHVSENKHLNSTSPTRQKPQKLGRNYHRKRAATSTFFSGAARCRGGEIASRAIYTDAPHYSNAARSPDPFLSLALSDRTPHLKDKYNFMVLLHTNYLHSSRIFKSTQV